MKGLKPHVKSGTLQLKQEEHRDEIRMGVRYQEIWEREENRKKG